MSEFEYLRMMVLPKSTCQKKAVAAGCYVGNNFVTASNDCEHTGHVCPRLGLPTGEQTDLCNSTHAEIRLLDKLQDVEMNIRPSVIWVYGHHYVCSDCAEAISRYGIKEIRIREH